ncbi:hypothetical protein SKAU_G00201820 [Synaphobranchus kaupii]|uniref:Uncharacterized protein n=1 Tax=Synaphobranchus kaupii TaxID=118154 RepID=A0A9Q1FG46_SYNKA|nr:hypothetical protein SKAU_G00201820 [Synaphobranchus kaupii]
MGDHCDKRPSFTSTAGSTSDSFNQGDKLIGSMPAPCIHELITWGAYHACYDRPDLTKLTENLPGGFQCFGMPMRQVAYSVSSGDGAAASVSDREGQRGPDSGAHVSRPSPPQLQAELVKLLSKSPALSHGRVRGGIVNRSRDHRQSQQH